jgi:hypothetical protein
LPRENPILFYCRRALEIVSTYVRAGLYYVWLDWLRERIEREPNASTYTDAALVGAPGPAVSSEGSGAVSTIPDYDPVKARDPGWRQAFKKNRARQNEEALELLKRTVCRGRAYLASGKREAEGSVPREVHALPVLPVAVTMKDCFG